MAQAYHWDALRKKRVLDRKHEALDRLMHAGSENPVPTHIMARACEPASNIVSTDPEQFNQIRSGRSILEVTHDTNFKYRVYKGTNNAPIHVDNIYKVIYPASYHNDNKCE
ncbi:hypothetical protein SNE40_005528 [Patella caerulea]|uniref:Uncharacterized protein n=1 Tax=Patella caerulea TaxID=87958 RepID=A0AAN8K3W1_PATCE